LALIEAVDNAIFHAHDRRADLPIQVVLSADTTFIRVEVGDRGNGIEHLFVDPPPESSTHGRGLFLIRSMVDEVESVKENGTHWMRMTYRL
jgi:anti-sigma regulatory factor (Ser/Thr protein kinase)